MGISIKESTLYTSVPCLFLHTCMHDTHVCNCKVNVCRAFLRAIFHIPVNIYMYLPTGYIVCKYIAVKSTTPLCEVSLQNIAVCAMIASLTKPVSQQFILKVIPFAVIHIVFNHLFVHSEPYKNYE